MALPLILTSPVGKRLFAISLLFLIITISGVVVALGPESVIERGERKLQRAWKIINGDLVSVNGHYLRVERKGESGPTVVFDSGLSQILDTWGSIPDQVAARTGVIVYERAGVGESDPIDSVRTSREVVEDLHSLLENTGAAKPYILVGHSFGGMNVRLFASRYPDEVAGLLLIDASHEEQFTRYAELMPTDQRVRFLRHERGENLERVNMLASGRQLRAARLRPMPAIVLTAGAERGKAAFNERERAHQEFQAELVRLVPGSRQIIADKSGHFIQQDQPDLVLESIFELTAKAERK